jgi:membrane peptidoglycan carboxypeptidase
VDFTDGRQSVSLDHGGSDSLFKDGETYEVTKVLQQNMKRGTGKAAQMGCPAAGKTGTTDNFKDAWFAGYTPRLSTVVWVGYPRRSLAMTNVHGIKVAGATFPAQLWHDYMSVAKGGYCGKFAKPSERPELHPFCGRLAVTRKCEVPAGSLDGAPPDPGEATPGAQQETTTEPAPVPLPDTRILGSPPSRTTARSAVFRFASQGPPSKGFECSVDAGPFAPCSSPADFGALHPGDHVFMVRALSPAGDPDASPASYNWTVFDDLVPSSPKKAEPAPKAKPPPERKPKSQDPPVLIG